MSAREDLVAAVITRLGRANFVVAELDDLKAMSSLPANYAEVHLSTTTPGLGRLGARGHRMGWRLQIRVNAKTMSNANVLLDQVHDDLYNTVLTAGRPSTLLDEEPSDLPVYDDGWYSALLSFTFTR